MPRTYPLKAERIKAKGYTKVFLPEHQRADKDGYVLEHILVMERALGRPLDRKFPVHHVDEDRANNTNTNLVICENTAYHRLLHVRTRALRRGGDPNLEKICWGCCMLKQILVDFTRNCSTADGLEQLCISCRKNRRRKTVDAI